MNLLLLLIGSHAWRAVSPLERLTRVCAAISVFSIEMQIVTWMGVGSLRTLPAINAVIAIVALAAWRPAPLHARPRPRGAGAPAGPRNRWFIASALLLGGLVLALNLGMQLEAADPYHLEKIERVASTGTLAYDPAAEAKINMLSSVYEMLLADLQQIPAIGPWVLRLHGIWSLLFWLLGVAVLRELLPAEGPGGPHPAWRWPWVVLLVVPTLFQELVLIKNDLFVAVPAVVVLAWAVTRARTAGPRDMALMLALAGFVVAVKLTMLPLLLVAGGAILLQRRADWPAIGAATLGTLVGLAAGGLIFTLSANLQFYGQLMPAGDQGNLTVGVAGAFTSLGRFAISLVDLGLITRAWWPGRGGWGSTFGLPFIWACAVLVWGSRRLPVARAALLAAGVYFLAFAAVFPDADLAHRLALAPALLVISVAVRVVEHGDQWRTWRLALVPVTLLSGAQIARSASLYFMR